MNTGRKGTLILLAGMFALFCLSFSAFAVPHKTFSQTPRSAPQSNCPNVADFEAALEEHRETEQILQARVRALEEAQKKLLGLEEEQKRLLEQFRLFPSSPLPPPPKPDTSLNWILGGVCVFVLALCVILLLRINRPKIVDESKAREELACPEKTSSSSLVGLTPPAPALWTSPEPRQGCPFVPALPDWDSASPALDLKAMLPEKNARNQDSTIELAEIMLSFGRINSAAEALTSFIENYPKEAFAPWLKLLEVYRFNGQRTEFDKIARKLNKTFNVWTVDWDNFTDALAPVLNLETMPHIVECLQKLWGTRECQAYLQHLLRDTRDETRRGFPLAAIEDILCLNDILEHHLGPYTGPISAFGNDLQDYRSVTETEDDKPGSHVLAEENKTK